MNANLQTINQNCDFTIEIAMGSNLSFTNHHPLK